VEFFRQIEHKLSRTDLHQLFRLDNLESWTEHLIALADPVGNQLEVGGIWEELTLERQKIGDGLRFSLRECPYALAWTLTVNSAKPGTLFIHLTLNRQVLCSEFESEVIEFADGLVQLADELVSASLVNV
jgi:hypothetical protein